MRITQVQAERPLKSCGLDPLFPTPAPSPPGLPLHLWILSKSLQRLSSFSSTGPWTRQVVERQLPLKDPMVGPAQSGM